MVRSNRIITDTNLLLIKNNKKLSGFREFFMYYDNWLVIFYTIYSEITIRYFGSLLSLLYLINKIKL